MPPLRSIFFQRHMGSRTVAMLLALGVPAWVGGQPAPPKPPAPTTRAAPIPPRLEKQEGRLFADKPGGTVTVNVGDKKLTLPDGEKVKFVEEQAAAGSGADAVAVIIARGQKGKVPNGQVITEARLHRAPDNSSAIFHAITNCGDVCHADVWLLSSGNRRQRLTDNAGPNVTVARSMDGKQIAVGATALYLISTADLKIETHTLYTAPAYAPDGALIVRGPDDQISELKGKTFQLLAAGPPQVPREEGDYGSEPTPVTFAADGKSFDALFIRGAGNLHTWVFDRSGKVLTKKKR